MRHIILLDDHKLFLQTLTDYLQQKLKPIKLEHHSNYQDLLGGLKKKQPDLIIIDLEMPEKSGIEVIKMIRERKIDVKLMVLSMFYNIQIASELKKLGVQGFVSKNAELPDLESAVNEILHGGQYFESEFSDDKIRSYSSNRKLLSKRELEIIQLSAKGLVSSEISGKLHISEGTVKTHIRNILNKYDCQNLKEVIAKYKSEGLNVLVQDLS